MSDWDIFCDFKIYFEMGHSLQFYFRLKKSNLMFSKLNSRPLLFFIFVFGIQLIVNKICQWLNSNWGSLGVGSDCSTNCPCSIKIAHQTGIIWCRKQPLCIDRGRGQVVSVLTSYSDDLSSNPDEVLNFSVELCLKRTEINKKESGVGQFF